MELCIFNKIEDDLCIKGILEKDNVIVLRNIIEFSETEGVTSSAIKEYVATRLANDDNILSRLAQAGKFIGDDLYRLAKFDIEQIYKKLFSTQIKYAPSGNPIGFSNGYVASIRAITESKSAQELLDLLIEHYRKSAAEFWLSIMRLDMTANLSEYRIPMILLLIRLSVLSIKNKC